MFVNLSDTWGTLPPDGYCTLLQDFLHLQNLKKMVLNGAVLGLIFKPSNSKERALNPNWRHRPTNPLFFTPSKCKVNTII